VLQEYFVPAARFDDWLSRMRRVFTDNDVNVVNVSIRHAKADPGARLAWARGETFAFVVYYKQGTDAAARQHVADWTRTLIDEVLSVGGTYYLPYQPHATAEQFRRAYPGSDEFFAIKRKYDPSGKFTNALWERYYHQPSR
jgi:FAD/FMN-containing dehydrogenase